MYLFSRSCKTSESVHLKLTGRAGKTAAVRTQTGRENCTKITLLLRDSLHSREVEQLMRQIVWRAEWGGGEGVREGV